MLDQCEYRKFLLVTQLKIRAKIHKSYKSLFGRNNMDKVKNVNSSMASHSALQISHYPIILPSKLLGSEIMSPFCRRTSATVH